MALAPRNAPCPCQSGRKYKKCCGADRESELALERRIEALESIARLAFRSPQLLPAVDAYDLWVGEVLARRRRPVPDEAIETLGKQEIERIVTACFGLFREEWEELSGLVADEREALGALLAGAVAAGIRDCAPIGGGWIADIEDDEELASDPARSLGYLLEGEMLWEIADGDVATAALRRVPDWVDDDVYDVEFWVVLDATAAELGTDWHRARLARLVDRIRGELPFAGYPRATAALERACRRFVDDPAVPVRLAATLLSDMLGRRRYDEIRELFAA
jgi:SEC-C motif